MSNIFKDWYRNIQEAATPKECQHAGEDLSSKEASNKAPNSKEKHKKDMKAKGPGDVDVPEAGADYASGKDKPKA